MAALSVLTPSLAARPLPVLPTDTNPSPVVVLRAGSTTLSSGGASEVAGATDALAQRTGAPTCPICHRERKEHHRLGVYWRKFGYAGPEYCASAPLDLPPRQRDHQRDPREACDSKEVWA